MREVHLLARTYERNIDNSSENTKESEIFYERMSQLTCVWRSRDDIRLEKPFHFVFLSSFVPFVASLTPFQTFSGFEAESPPRFGTCAMQSA